LNLDLFLEKNVKGPVCKNCQFWKKTDLKNENAMPVGVKHSG
jgi:hypothetical protein